MEFVLGLGDYKMITEKLLRKNNKISILVKRKIDFLFLLYPLFSIRQHGRPPNPSFVASFIDLS
jgi:hypothetical protein